MLRDGGANVGAVLADTGGENEPVQPPESRRHGADRFCDAVGEDSEAERLVKAAIVDPENWTTR